MSLRNQCYLEIDIQGGSRTGVFNLREGLDITTDVDKQYLMSNRGQYVREVVDIGSDLLPDDVADADLENRRGYHVDGGAGTYGVTVTGTATIGDRWGDGSDDGRYDASGDDLISMQQCLDWYVAQSKSDSSGGTLLHIGEWCDDSFAQSAGAFGEPMTVAIQSSNVSNEAKDPSAIEVTLELAWTSVFPNVDVVGGAEDALRAVGDAIPDF